MSLCIVTDGSNLVIAGIMTGGRQVGTVVFFLV